MNYELLLLSHNQKLARKSCISHAVLWDDTSLCRKSIKCITYVITCIKYNNILSSCQVMRYFIFYDI